MNKKTLAELNKRFSTKIGGSDLNGYYKNILHTEMEDNILLSVFRYVFNDERLKTFDGPVGEGKVQVFDYIDSQEFNAENFLQNGEISENSIFYTIKHGLLVYAFKDVKCLKSATEFIVGQAADQMTKLGWYVIEDLSKYVDLSGKSVVLHNELSKSNVIITLADQILMVEHLAASAVSRLFPWAFESNPLTDEELSTLKMIYEGNFVGFADKLDSMYDHIRSLMYEKEIRDQIHGFTNGFYNSRIDVYTERIKEDEERIRNYYDEIRRRRRNINDTMVLRADLQNKILSGAENGEEFSEYLIRNKTLKFIKKDGDKIYLAAFSFLSEYDEDMFDCYVKNQRTKDNYVYEESPYDFDLTKKLYRAIWEERRWKVRTYSVWSITNGCHVHTEGDYIPRGLDIDIDVDRLPQPHIVHYNCTGSYEDVFEELEAKGDFIGSMNTIVQSSSCINWSDSVVCRQFFEDFFNDGKKFLEDKDGNLYTVSEVVNILKGE